MKHSVSRFYDLHVVGRQTKKAIIKTAIIALSGMKDVPIGLLFSLWFNNNAPIAIMVCSFTRQNTHRT